jgi:hypothetical protein
MLHFYAFSNFQSFFDRTEISLALSAKTSTKSWTVQSASGDRYTTALAILGANGAGKTALIKPLAFVDWFFRHSFAAKPDQRIPITPHFSSPESPTEIELEAEDKQGTVWRYVLKLTPKRVLYEALFKKKERFSYVFIREWDEATDQYLIKQQGFNFAIAEARKVRPNASLISTAAQYGVEVALHLLNFNLVSNVGIIGRHHFNRSQLAHAAHLYGVSDDLRLKMVSLLKGWDLGLSDVLVEELVLPDAESKGEGKPEKSWIAKGIHRTRSGELVPLLMELESSGTQAAYVLLSRLLDVLSEGGVAAIDEMESDLHPHMLEPILDLFADPEANPHHAQLIFTCHSPEVLDLLQKSQVMLVEKTNCESVAYRADSIQRLRSDDNFRAKYMAGALGAVPKV